MCNCRLILLCVTLAFGPGALRVHAQGADPVILAQTLRKTQAMLQKLVAENERLRAEQDSQQAALAEIQDTAARVRSLEPALAEARQRTAGLQRRYDALQARVARDTARIREARERLGELSRRVASLEADNATLVAAVQEREAWIDDAARRNAELVEVNRELLQRPAPDMWTALKRAEPLTQIGRVADETRVQRYRHRLEDLRVTPWQTQDRPAASP